MRQPDSVIPVASSDDFELPGPDGPIPVRRYRPDVDGPLPAVVFFHGGGFVIGDLDTHDHQCRAVCRDVEAVVLSVQYRLAPEARADLPGRGHAEARAARLSPIHGQLGGSHRR